MNRYQVCRTLQRGIPFIASFALSPSHNHSSTASYDVDLQRRDVDDVDPKKRYCTLYIRSCKNLKTFI